MGRRVCLTGISNRRVIERVLGRCLHIISCTLPWVGVWYFSLFSDVDNKWNIPCRTLLESSLCICGKKGIPPVQLPLIVGIMIRETVASAFLEGAGRAHHPFLHLYGVEDGADGPTAIPCAVRRNWGFKTASWVLTLVKSMPGLARRFHGSLCSLTPTPVVCHGLQWLPHLPDPKGPGKPLVTLLMQKKLKIMQRWKGTHLECESQPVIGRYSKDFWKHNKKYLMFWIIEICTI